MDQTVMLTKVPSYDPILLAVAVERIFNQFIPAGALSPTTKVLLKPNLVTKQPPEKAVTTHPQVLLAVIRACQNRGVVDIMVADSAGGLYNPAQMRGLYKGCGLTEVCEGLEGVTLYDACETTVIPAKNGTAVTEFEFLNPLLEADYIINLPKFKTHVMTGMTAATKNMYGAIPGLVKSQFHLRFPDRKRFGEMLIDLYQTLPPQLSILDGVVGMEGDGPTSGTPREIGILLASQDSLSLDLAVAEMMGFTAERIPYLAVAHTRGLCHHCFDRSLLVGDLDCFALLEGFRFPRTFQGADGSTSFASTLPKPLQKMVASLEHTFAPHPVIRKNKCIGCGKCSEICSKNAITITSNCAKVIQRDCIRCFCCHEMCPVDAIDIQTNPFLKL